MRVIKLVFIGLFAVLFMACTNNRENGETDTDGDLTTDEQVDSNDMDDMTSSTMTAEAMIDAKSGSDVDGTVSFKQMSNGDVMMTLSLTGLEAGTHAVHLHENGDCSADDGSSAGGHWNPTTEDHGKWGEDAHHLGDIGNLDVSDDGTANMTFTTDQWTLEAGAENSILNKAVVVHAKADDFTSQPSGAAGARIGCGVVQ